MKPSSASTPPAPRRRWGQNFLADPAVAERLVERFDPGPEDVVLEIGPGRGALTRLVAPRVRRLIAVEVDPKLVEPLRGDLAPWPGAEVWAEDALSMDWKRLDRRLGGRFRLLANLPYNIGTAIVRRALQAEGLRDLQVVLQLEVVERFLAREGVKAYGPLSIVSRLRGDVRRVMTLSPSLFRPRPKVRSAAMAIRIERSAPLPASHVEWLESWLFRGFGQRRKTLATNLRPWRDQVRGFLETHDLPLRARAEAIPPALWLELATLLDPPGSPPPGMPL